MAAQPREKVSPSTTDSFGAMKKVPKAKRHSKSQRKEKEGKFQSYLPFLLGKSVMKMGVKVLEHSYFFRQAWHDKKPLCEATEA